MAKRKGKAKRSLGVLPKGLPGRKRGLPSNVNPFETLSRQKRPKMEVHNRFHHSSKSTSSSTPQPSALAKSLQRRQRHLKETMRQSKKANAFVDRRIGEYSSSMTQDEQMLARLVKERSRRSKRASKYSLEDDDGGDVLTHKGRVIDDFSAKDHVMLSDDDEEDNGYLDAVDTELHFGGGSLGGKRTVNPYGPSSSSSQQNDMAEVYTSRKTELDDLIARRKILKAERIKSKEDQVEAFETMDESFKELSSLLQFRDKEKERREREEAKHKGLLTEEDKEMAEWDKDMKTYLFERRVKATDRTKTPEEIAKEEAERLHELETRRLARMNGDFEDDDFSDISDEEGRRGRKKTKAKRKSGKLRNPEELTDSEDEADDEGLRARFTADGLVYVDKDGNIVKNTRNEEPSDQDSSDEQEESCKSGDDSSSDDSESSDEEPSKDDFVLSVGDRVQGNYRIMEQFEGQAAWYDGVVSKVNRSADGTITYNVEYDDGDFEENMEPQNVRPVEKSKAEQEREENKKDEELRLKRKRQKAREKARQQIPFVFEVPTTLEALHDMIGNYASTGTEASLIIQRIHSSNSVRLNKNNKEKMQNFYDVLLRRFIAIGNAIAASGDGGPELGRFKQLDALTKTLYKMSQDSPNCAGAVWGRRLGILQKAHAKRLRDSEFVSEEEEEDFTAWPSLGDVLLLRALGHIFPATDQRHIVVTPALLLLGQIITQAPVRSLEDISVGVLCSGIMIEYTREAKRVVPEALAFLAGVLRLFSPDPLADRRRYAVPSLQAACHIFTSLRTEISSLPEDCAVPRLCFEKTSTDDDTTRAAGVFCAALQLIEKSAQALDGSLQNGEAEAFAEITESLLCLKPTSKKHRLPKAVTQKVASVAVAVADACKLDQPRTPLKRRSGPSVSEMAIKSLAPRMEDPTRYSMSKDKGKSSIQAAMDRTRREYKREHKAVSRELRLDAAFIESERRQEKDRKDRKAREKRQKNFAWLEGEQAAMNQQVRLGGGLLSGGGTGAARAKAKSAKLGIKKGGKF